MKTLTDEKAVLSGRFPDLQQFTTFRAVLVSMLLSGKAIAELPHIRLRMADVEYNLHVGMVTCPARQLPLDLEAPKCRIVNRALTRN